MTRGFYIDGECRIGGDFSAAAQSIPSVHSVLRSIEEGKAPKTAIGIGFDSINTEQVYTAETAEKKIREIVALQQEYHRDDSGKVGNWSSFVMGKSDKGTGILMLDTPALAIPAKTHVYPAHLALYCLAYTRGDVKPGVNTLILFFFDDSVMSLATMGETVVFARRFHDNARLAMNIKLSAQSVFFEKQRHFIKTDKILVISSNAEDARKVEKACAGESPVSHLDVSGYFADQGLSETERARLILAQGVSLAPQIAPLAHWNILNTPKGQWQKNKWFILRCAALLLLAPPLIFAAEILSDKLLIKELNKKSKAIEPLYQRVSDIIASVESMKDFSRDFGRNLIGPDICFNLFSEIDQARSKELCLNSIAGNPYNTVSANGSAADYPTILDFVEHLGKSKAIDSSELIYANLREDGRVDFQIIIKYKFAREFGLAEANLKESER